LCPATPCQQQRLHFIKASWFAKPKPYVFIQEDQKVTQPIPDTCSICQKINYIEIKNKNNVILSVGNVFHVQ
jgi:hypothetical protein